jgi:hypothetical protein
MALKSKTGEPDLATDIEFDYVIVGGGAAGCKFLIAELEKSYGFKILKYKLG